MAKVKEGMPGYKRVVAVRLLYHHSYMDWMKRVWMEDAERMGPELDGMMIRSKNDRLVHWDEL